MRKNIFINAAGLLLALAIALGGLLGVRIRLAHEETRLLQEGGLVELLVQSEPEQSVAVSTTRLTRTPLTEEELTLAVESLESGQEPYPHEPKQGQLSMSDALEYGRSWIEDFLIPHLGMTDFCLEEYRAGCYLWTMQEDAPLLSYWTVTFSAQNLDAELILNATSGQVLDASVRCSLPVEHQDAESMAAFLDDYASSFGLPEEYTLVGGGDKDTGLSGQTMYRSVGDGGIFAAMKISSILVSGSDPAADPEGLPADPAKSLNIIGIRLGLTAKIQK